MYSVIEAYCRRNGLVFGICDAGDLVTANRGDAASIPFFQGEARDRLCPRRFLPGAESIIVLGVKADFSPIMEHLDSVMAPSLSGYDYHRRLQALALGLVKAMEVQKTFSYRIQVDSGPLMERELAIKAGVGVQGKNKSVISNEYGSYMNLALVVTDLRLDYTKQTRRNNTNTCKDCDTCLRYCPTGALAGNGAFDYEKCISYLTQKKGLLDMDEMGAIGVSLYGCDICRRHCPHNGVAPAAALAGKAERGALLQKILGMGKRAFANEFSQSNFYWRGKTVIQRNALISLHNLDPGVYADFIKGHMANRNEILGETAKRLINGANG